MTASNFHDNPHDRELVGVFPAGGYGNRIGPLPVSKELYPIGFHHLDATEQVYPKVVCQYLLERLRLADVSKVYIVLREGKWDIPAYLGDGTKVGLNFAYLMMNLPFGAPYTIDQAYPFVKENIIVFGFPDIIFNPKDAFVQLLSRQSETGADIVLGLFPTDQPHKADMVELDQSGHVRRVVIKPSQSDLTYTWIIAVWTPVFTRFMHEYLAKTISSGQNAEKPSELHVGDIIQAAIQEGLNVETVRFPNGRHLDIGTPDNLVKAVYDGVLPFV